MTNIIVAFHRVDDAQNIKNILVRNGWNQVSVCTSGARALVLADQYESGIVICGYRLPDMAFMQLKEDMPPGFEMLLIASPGALQGVSLSGANCLETPFKIPDLLRSIRWMEEDATRRRRRRREQPRQRSPEERELIQSAKEVLMKSNHISEDEAHKYLLRTSMQSGRNLLETAQMILLLKK